MILRNAQGDCTTETKGTSLGDCVKLYGDLIGIDIYKTGYKIPLSGALPTEEEYKALIQSEALYPLNDVDEFDQPTPEPEIKTNSRGGKSKIRNGKPEFTFTWELGGCWDEFLQDKDGQNRWAIALKFETGLLMAYTSDFDNIKPFDNRMFSVGTFKLRIGTETEMSSLAIQFPTEVEWNNRKAFYTWETLGYDQTTVAGVQNAVLSYPTAPVAGTTFTLKVSDYCNGSISILGLDSPTNWSLGGVQASVTTIDSIAYNATTEEYTFTLDTALVSTDTIQPKLVDGSDNVAENASGDYYKGVADIATIA